MPGEKKISDAKRKANNKYDLANYTVVGCKVRKEIADQFRDVCKQKNTSPNAVFRDAIYDFMKKEAGVEISFTKEDGKDAASGSTQE